MKKPVLLPYFLLLNSIVLSAQIPNNGFENWSAAGNCNEADFWHSTNLFDTSAAYCPVSLSTDHFPASVGSYSMRLENDPSLFPSFSAFGIASTTRLDGTDQPLFAITGHPNSLCGYFKFMCSNNDTMSINIYLSYQGNEISSSHFTVDSTVANWTPFVLPLYPYVVADSARITIMACNIEGAGAQGNSALYIDNLSFDTLISAGISGPITDNGIRIFPSPASDHVEITNLTPGESIKAIEVYDSSGRLVRLMESTNSSTNTTMDVYYLEEGLYFITTRTLSGKAMTGKVVVSR
ncbi:MAG: T9SS type A sorting domain-containing protein [Bacteroidota bacterium]